jgi:hypothetical protein
MPVISLADQIAPRGLTKEQAAAYCGCGLDAFETWVKKGLVPGAIPGTQRWDRKAIDVWLDRASGLAVETPESNPLKAWQSARRRAAS